MAQIADGSFFDQVSAAFHARDPDAQSKQRESSHVRCVQLLYHAIARGAFAEALELVTDDFTLEIFGPPDSPFNGRWEGRDEVLAAMEHNFSLVADQRPEIETVVAQGDLLIITARESGTVRSTGYTYNVRWMQEFTFDEGKMTHVRELVDGSADFGPAD